MQHALNILRESITARYRNLPSQLTTAHIASGLRMGVAVILLAAVGSFTLARIRTLHDWESSRRELVLNLSEIERIAERYSALEWSTIAGATDVGEAASQVVALQREFNGYEAKILALASQDREGAGRLRIAFAAYYENVDQVFEFLRRGWYEDARRLDVIVGRPIFDNFKHEVERQKRQQSDRARAAGVEVITDITRLLGGALALVLLVLGALMRSRTVAARRRAAEEAVREREERFRALVQSSWDVITVLDDDDIVSYQSAALQRVLGFGPHAFVGHAIRQMIHPDDHALVAGAFLAARVAPHATATVTCRLRHADRSWRNCEVVATNLLGEPSVQGLVLNIRDVTERHTLEEELRHQAFHDSLTGLANRALLLDRIDHALARFGRGAPPMAVLLLDLDGFKGVNDSLGHDKGDELLVAVADELRQGSRSSDTVARLGGDEFAIVVEDLHDPGDAQVIVDRILAGLRRSFPLGDTEVRLTASAGVALATGDERDASDLLRDADVAMYVAKRSGKDRCVAFEPPMREMVVDRHNLETDLREALARNEFVVHYQPIFTVLDRRLVGVEALVRWAHPVRGLVPPAEFIPVAEESGLIGAVGAVVLREACHQVRRWQESRTSMRHLSLSVNVSVCQLQDPGLVDTVAAALADSGLDPAALVLELTESGLVDDSERTVEALTRLKALGVRLAIDDFGTGYSSLSYLRRLPIDVVKIDRSFISGLPADREALALVHAIVRLGDALCFETVAEGIETPDQLTELESLGCDLGQGYHLGRPMPGPAFEATFAEAVAGSLAS